MKTSCPLVVDLLQIGELPRGVRLERLLRLLRRQDQISFRLRDNPVDIGQLLQPPDGFFFTEKELFPGLEPSGEAHLVVGITTLRIAPSIDALDPENEYFGVWHNAQVPLAPEHARKGVVSITLWRERFEERAYRSTEQYLAFMILAFLGDAQLGGLTHPWCTGCVFDYNPENESIVSSVKAATLCDTCRQRIENARPPIKEAFLDILKEVERPPVRAVLSYLQGNGIASVFLFSVLLALSVGLLQNLLPDAGRVGLATSLFCAIIFLAVVWYYRRFPSGGLR